jgi:hypothetical protein
MRSSVLVKKRRVRMQGIDYRAKEKGKGTNEDALPVWKLSPTQREAELAICRYDPIRDDMTRIFEDTKRC